MTETFATAYLGNPGPNFDLVKEGLCPIHRTPLDRDGPVRDWGWCAECETGYGWKGEHLGFAWGTDTHNTATWLSPQYLAAVSSLEVDRLRRGLHQTWRARP